MEKTAIERQKAKGSIAYVVQWVDTLQNIAKSANKNVKQLLKANNLSENYLINTTITLL
ncbi:LysM peptidoglycan-binding domain-containing protein [Aerococcaceae bacterium WGS1372]